MSSILFTAWGYQVSILEFLSATTSLTAVLLGIKGTRITWPWWGFSSVLYGVFFLDAKLYASAALQIVFIAAAIWGWFGWGPDGARPGALGKQERINWFYGLLIGCIIATPALASIGAAATWSDAFIFFASLIAQVLMIYEKYEAWTLWLLVDTVATIQYAILGYWFTCLLYAIFTVIAAFGWSRWYGSHRRAIRSL
jgi:nicotinamide mononucleotide transporter